MSDTLRSALIFLINTLFDFYLFILIIRVLLAWVGAYDNNPLTHLIVKLTSFIVQPLRRVIPDIKTFETATFLLVVVLDIFKFLIIGLLSFGFPHNLFGLLILAIGDILKIILQTYFYAILLQAIMSFVQPGQSINFFLDKMTAPVLRPFRRFLPLIIAGFDFSPLFAMIFLYLLILIVVNPIMAFGLGVAFA